jgi:hypothetical protein
VTTKAANKEFMTMLTETVAEPPSPDLAPKRPPARHLPKPSFLLGGQALAPRPRQDASLTDIYVNGSWQAVASRRVSHEEIVALADGSDRHHSWYTVTFRDGDPSWSFGELQRGEAVPVVQNMRFWVAATTAS